MKRIIPLPPLIPQYEMSSKGVQYSKENADNSKQSEREQSVTSSMDLNNDFLPTDLVLVFDPTNKECPEGDGTRSKESKTPSEQRSNFEECLWKQQGLVLRRIKSHTERYIYVTVHTPFDILLLTAENMQMKLPIEKVEDDSEHSSAVQASNSNFKRFISRLKQPFYLDSSLMQNDPDYYTAIYSSNIEKFKDYFVSLRGSKDLYFTSTERSLLTYELLSRDHFTHNDHNEGDHQQMQAESYKSIATMLQGPKISKRPGIDRLKSKKVYECYFPLHQKLRDNLQDINDRELTDREKLKKYWATMRQCWKFQPLSLIRSYMGEKVAFYFALCGFYNTMLIPPALIGFIIFLYGIGSVFSDQPTSDICGNFGQETYMCPRCDKTCPFWKLSDSCLYSKVSYVFDNAATVVFAILMSLWARWFVEFWKRRQAVLRYDWDSIGFEKHFEPLRPQFETKAKKKGEMRTNPVTGIEEPYVTVRTRLPFFLAAGFVVIFMMLIVCATVFATIVYRSRMNFILKNSNAKAYSSIIITVTSAAMNLICSIVLSRFYYWIARKLTDFELHKYQSRYDGSLTIKIYLFQFVNFYSSLFYIAFFKGRFLQYPSKYDTSGSGSFTEQCDPAGCFVELSIQVLIIMVGKQFINNLIEFFNAMQSTLSRIFFERGKPESQEQWEKDHKLYDFKSDTLMNEYLELVIQFGFVTLFVTAFPLAPLFALFNNIIELRLDAWKFLSKYKRPIPFKASDIGIWSDIISGISYLAVLTNGVVIAWTSEFIPKMAYRTLESTGGNLNGYANWTLSSFNINDYNLTNTIPQEVPNNLTFCRYRDFRESIGPDYSETATYWNVLAARLAFIIVFEHVIFSIIYLISWIVPDVPIEIQNKIDHERYIDQRERWASKTTENHFKEAMVASLALSDMVKISKETINNHAEKNLDSSKRLQNRKRQVGIPIQSDNN